MFTAKVLVAEGTDGSYKKFFAASGFGVATCRSPKRAVAIAEQRANAELRADKHLSGYPSGSLVPILRTVSLYNHRAHKVEYCN